MVRGNDEERESRFSTIGYKCLKLPFPVPFPGIFKRGGRAHKPQDGAQILRSCPPHPLPRERGTRTKKTGVGGASDVSGVSRGISERRSDN